MSLVQQWAVVRAHAWLPRRNAPYTFDRWKHACYMLRTCRENGRFSS